MNSYIIGLIDEDSTDIDFIKRTILINKPNDITDGQVDFWESPLPENSFDDIVKRIIEAITNEKIHMMIIDYKIVVSTKSYEGTTIFKQLSEIVPKFPIIMLSNLSGDCHSKEYVDSDKVYSKRDFFKIESQYSKDKVFNIFRNMEKYINQRAKLTTELVKQLERWENDGYSADSLQSIVEVEKDLDNYTPQNQNTVEKALDLTELKKAVDILKNVQDLIGGGQNED